MNFDVNKSSIDESYHEYLDKVVKYLTEFNYRIKISGHTDNTGDENNNIILSEERAVSVAKYLMKKGISSDRVIVVGQ